MSIGNRYWEQLVPITQLHFTNVGPFDEITFDFDHQINVFVGPNNSGKSSVLSVLGDVLVYPFSFPSKLLRESKEAIFNVQLLEGKVRHLQGQLPLTFDFDNWNDERTKQYFDFLKLIGFSKFMPALRRSTDFRSSGPRSRQSRDNNGFSDSSNDGSRNQKDSYTEQRLQNKRGRKKSSKEIEPELRKRIALVSRDASLVSDEEIIQKFIELEFRSFLRKQSDFNDILVKIGEMASEITEGFPVRFAGTDEDSNGFYPKFETIDGYVPLNTLSQGTQSIIQLLAHFLISLAEYYDFPENLEEKPGILIVDEIDAHLHPSWQRQIIPTLTRHFPHLQIFCSTHSPLMLAGLKEGQVQLLRRDEAGEITAIKK